MKTELSVTVSLAVLLSLFLGGCDSNSSGPTGVNGSSVDGPSAPTIPSEPMLLMPINGALVRQNDPAIGCSPHPARSHGFRISFDWTDAQAENGIAGYELFAAHNSVENPMPIVNVFVSESEFTRTNCNAFVANINLGNWAWRVRARDTQGVLGAWSEIGVFGFEPCRLESGNACFAP